MNEPTVTIEITRDIAQRISNQLSDLALWCHGFNAALGAEESSRRPWGTDAITDINLRLKMALDRVDGHDVDVALTEAMQTAWRVSNAARDAGDDRAHAAAAYIHDEIVNNRRRRSKIPGVVDPAPWPFKEGGTP